MESNISMLHKIKGILPRLISRISRNRPSATLDQSVLQANNENALQALNQRLAEKERVFRAPPLTRELVSAIRLISPQLDLNSDETSRLLWEADQNGACWGEFEALLPLFEAMPIPTKILEIGPGMGRSLVFFSKRCGWSDSEIHAYEGEGNSTKYTRMGPRFTDSFCGNFGILRELLAYNEVHNVTMIDAQEVSLSELPGPYDFLYSFYSIGFHWSLASFLEDLLAQMHDHSIAVFTVPPEFTPFDALNQVYYKLLDWEAVWPKGLRLKMLAISRSPLPELDFQPQQPAYQ